MIRGMHDGEGVVPLNANGKGTCSSFVGVYGITVEAAFRCTMWCNKATVVVDELYFGGPTHMREIGVGGLDAGADVLIVVVDRQDGGHGKRCLWETSPGSSGNSSPCPFSYHVSPFAVIYTHMDDHSFEVFRWLGAV